VLYLLIPLSWQVGVMHTNYSELSRRTLGGAAGALVGIISHVMNALLCSIHTHKARLPRLLTEAPQSTSMLLVVLKETTVCCALRLRCTCTPRRLAGCRCYDVWQQREYRPDRPSSIQLRCSRREYCPARASSTQGQTWHPDGPRC